MNFTKELQQRTIKGTRRKEGGGKRRLGLIDEGWEGINGVPTYLFGARGNLAQRKVTPPVGAVESE